MSKARKLQKKTTYSQSSIKKTIYLILLLLSFSFPLLLLLIYVVTISHITHRDYSIITNNLVVAISLADDLVYMSIH